jgi:hypothetical protein
VDKDALINKLHMKGVVRLSGRAGLLAYHILSIPPNSGARPPAKSVTKKDSIHHWFTTVFSMVNSLISKCL